MSLKDAPAGYGWLSIGLHWFNAVAVVMLWFIGRQTTGEHVPPDQAAELVRVHTSVAVTVYAVIWVRIGWRFYSGHPKGLPDQGRYFFLIARAVHYTLLVTIAVMLITGPLKVWLGGEAIAFYNLGTIPSPFAINEALHNLLTDAHRWGGNVLFVVALLHMTAAAKQLVFAQGETARRMTWPTGHD